MLCSREDRPWPALGSHTHPVFDCLRSTPFPPLQGKLRVLYECFPMAFLVEQVGGRQRELLGGDSRCG